MSDSRDIILIGVDGGGTGCRAAIADATQTVLAEADGDRANVATDFQQAIQNVQKTISDAGRKAGLSDHALHNATVHMGLAGVISDAVAGRVARAMPYATVTVTDDRATTVAGALDGGDGFLISVGTGTIIAARRDGQNSFVNGWGFHVSDQASGAWLGRRLLEETLLWRDGLRADSDLAGATLANFGDDPNEIVRFSLTAKPGDYGRLAPDVVRAAKAGDQLGVALMQDGFDYLETGLQALGFRPGDRLCLTGGVGTHYANHFEKDFAPSIIAQSGLSVRGAVRLAAMALPSAMQVTS